MDDDSQPIDPALPDGLTRFRGSAQNRLAPGIASSHAGGTPRRGWGVDLLYDRRGNFWIGTQDQGLWRIRRSTGTGNTGIEALTVDDGIASNAVQSLLEDREGNVWVGTLAGLQRLTPHRVTPVKHLPR